MLIHTQNLKSDPIAFASSMGWEIVTLEGADWIHLTAEVEAWMDANLNTDGILEVADSTITHCPDCGHWETQCDC